MIHAVGAGTCPGISFAKKQRAHRSRAHYRAMSL
jgi:hypothetical protein